MISLRRPVQALVCARVNRVLHLVSTTIAAFLVCLPLLSQTNQGRIQGAVFDQSGGAMLAQRLVDAGCRDLVYLTVAHRWAALDARGGRGPCLHRRRHR